MLRDKSPKTLVEAQEQATMIEKNLLACKVEPFHIPHAKAETKPKTMNNVEPTQDSVMLLAQKLEQLINEVLQN